MGRPVLYAHEIERMTVANNVYNGYISMINHERNGGNRADWASNNKVLSKLFYELGNE
jgi:hypothetical protein